MLQRRLSLPPAPCLALTQRGEPGSKLRSIESSEKASLTSLTDATALVFATGTFFFARTCCERSLSWPEPP